MSHPQSLKEQVEANLPKLDARPEFAGDRLWLTFYLGGSAANLAALAHVLKKNGWTNLDGWEGGMIYAKVEVDKSVSAIVEAAEATQKMCGQFGAVIDLIDADTSSVVEQSKFETLYRGWS